MDIEQKVWETLCTEEEIKERIQDLGAQITQDYQAGKLLVISLLKGSFIFAADLVRAVRLPVKIEFMTTSSYGNGEVSSGEVTIVHDVRSDISDYDVLVVDDIVDSGLTMEYVLTHLRTRHPRSLRTCVLLDKPGRREVIIEPDYVGFTIEDKFVVGYGLNYGDYYRNIPYIFAVTPKDRV